MKKESPQMDTDEHRSIKSVLHPCSSVSICGDSHLFFLCGSWPVRSKAMTATKSLTRCLLLMLAVLAPAAYASDTIPGQPQDRPILLTGGDAYTVSGEVIRGGEVLFDK